MGQLFFSSILLGIAFCAPPGIVTAETVRRGMARGYGSALLVQLGSLIGDATWAVIALTGAAFLVQNITARLILGGFGVAILFWLAMIALRDAARGEALATQPVSRQNDFVTGMLLSLSNPFAIAFWLGAGSSTVTALIPNPQFIHFAWFFLAFMLGALAYCFFMAGLVAKGRQWLRGSFFRWVNLVCGFILLGFMFQLAWKLVQILLESA